MTDDDDLLSRTLELLDPHRAKFAEEVSRDLGRRHPHVLGKAPALEGTRLFDAMSVFVGDVGGSEGDEHELEPERDVVDLADAMMKSFARCLGRAKWTAQMALAWNRAMRLRGGELLDTLHSDGAA